MGVWHLPRLAARLTAKEPILGRASLLTALYVHQHHCIKITKVYSAKMAKLAVVQRPCTLPRRDRRGDTCIFTVPRKLIAVFGWCMGLSPHF
jgi:hypothetical protein